MAVHNLLEVALGSRPRTTGDGRLEVGIEHLVRAELQTVRRPIEYLTAVFISDRAVQCKPLPRRCLPRGRIKVPGDWADPDRRGRHHNQRRPIVRRVHPGCCDGRPIDISAQKCIPSLNIATAYRPGAGE